jgi:hypothetical protein
MKTQFQVKPRLFPTDHPVGKVITPSQRVYACTWSPDTDLTPEMVQEAWKANRRDFEPYDESQGVYLR